MRIVQIIDSLEAGGAERMAVNYANALSDEIDFSGLISTRKEGELKNQIDPNVPYLFIQKKKRIDFRAIFGLRDFVKKNKVDIIHAHSSSFFIAVLVKLTLPKIKIIWHDHYGARAKETKQQNMVLIIASLFFTSIFVVSRQLEEWNKKNMFCKNIVFIPNFSSEEKDYKKVTELNGTEGKRIIFLANLKNPKNHILVLNAFSDLKLKELDWTLHLIGKDYLDCYSEKLKAFIKSNSLENHIYIYGVRSDINYILSQGSIGVLASTEEGFPVTLLEYGLSNLAVASTNVGYCSVIINNEFNGMLFNPLSELEIKQQLLELIENDMRRNRLGANLKQSITENYSKRIVIKQVILAYNN